MLEFGEFCQLAAKFLVEEDEEALKKELKEAFRIYDKEGKKLIFLKSKIAVDIVFILKFDNFKFIGSEM